MNQNIEWAAIFVPISILLILGSLFSFRSYTGLKLGQAFFALAASVVAGAFSAYHRALALEPLIQSRYERNRNVEIYLAIAAVGLVYPLIVALSLRLWGRWIGGKATPAECEPGVAGIRAWFCASNIGVAVLLVDFAWYGYDVSPFLGAVIVAALLAAYPILRMESSVPAAVIASPVGEDLSAEREKIVSMLEAGKLTPEESAELLQALGESSRAPSRQVPLTGHQRLMLIGASLVALGFFLPWFVINPGKEMNHLFGQMQSSMPGAAGNQFPASLPGYPPQPPGYPPQQDPSGYSSQIATGDVSVSGGDIQHGLGWAALALALAAALIPYVATALDTHTARIIRLLCLGVGGLIVLYLATQNLRFVGFGLIIAVSGYALEIAGAMRERNASA